MRWRYRVGQFTRRLRARPTGEDLRVARETLPSRAFALFAAMPAGDQLHGLAVLRLLRGEGHGDGALAQAALLHDVGKAGAGLTLVHRSLAVILERLAPGLLRRLARPAAGGWRYPFYAHLYHAEIGARRAEAAGCDPLVVALIRHHDGPGAWPDASAGWQECLQALRRADERE